MYARGFLKGVVYKGCSQCVGVWGRNLGNESRGVSEAASHREENAENDLCSDVEG